MTVFIITVYLWDSIMKLLEILFKMLILFLWIVISFLQIAYYLFKLCQLLIAAWSNSWKSNRILWIDKGLISFTFTMNIYNCLRPINTRKGVQQRDQHIFELVCPFLSCALAALSRTLLDNDVLISTPFIPRTIYRFHCWSWKFRSTFYVYWYFW